MYDEMFLNNDYSIDLLEAVECESFLNLYENSFNTKELPANIFEEANDLLIYGYETHRYIVEAETTMLTTTKYVSGGDAKEIQDSPKKTKLLDRIKKVLKNILDKLIKFIGKAKEWIKKSYLFIKKKIEDYKVAGNIMYIIKAASLKDKNLTLTRVIVSNDAIKFIENFDGIYHNKFTNICLDAINEVINFFKDKNAISILNNMENNDEKQKYLASKCPKYVEILKLCDNDASKLKDVILANVGLPISKNDNFIIIGDEIPAKNYIQYCPNIEKMMKNISSASFVVKSENILRSLDIKRIELIRDRIDSLKYMYPKISSALVVLLECIMYVYNYGDSCLNLCLKASNTHCNNIMKCYKVVDPKGAAKIEKEQKMKSQQEANYAII